MRYFLKLSYLGAGYHGWQSQPNAPSVQSVLEEALSTILRNRIEVVGAGRTDAGVNARTMYAHFDYPGAIDSYTSLRGLNRLLGRNITVSEIREVVPEAHARFDALSRTYKYFISFSKTCFLHPLCWECGFSLDRERMDEAARILLTTSDFTSFAKLHSDARTNICRVSEAGFREWNPLLGSGEGLVFTITADRFLRNMVRAIVGTLVDVGRGRLSADDFRHIIDSKNRCMAGTSMPGNALYLWDVAYPESIFI